MVADLMEELQLKAGGLCAPRSDQSHPVTGVPVHIPSHVSTNVWLIVQVGRCTSPVLPATT